MPMPMVFEIFLMPLLTETGNYLLTMPTWNMISTCPGTVQHASVRLPADPSLAGEMELANALYFTLTIFRESWILGLVHQLESLLGTVLSFQPNTKMHFMH